MALSVVFVCRTSLGIISGIIMVQSLVEQWANHGDSATRHTLDLPYAILDLKFSPFSKEVFAVATSKGTVCLCTVKSQGVGPIEIFWTYKIFPDPSLTLSLAWAPLQSDCAAIAASSSDGAIAIFDTKEQDPEIKFKMHDNRGREVWTVAWTASQCPHHEGHPDLISGGDDSTFCRYELYKSVDGGCRSLQYDIANPLRDKSSHDAGVTALLPLVPVIDSTQLILTGSYDENVRLLSIDEDYSQPGILEEKNLGGGVWSLKQLFYRPPIDDIGASYMVLASCMHAGAQVLQVRQKRGDEGKWEINVRAKNVEHQSMNYASAGQLIYGETMTEGLLFVSTSFYDKKLCVWYQRVPQRVCEAGK